MLVPNYGRDTVYFAMLSSKPASVVCASAISHCLSASASHSHDSDSTPVSGNQIILLDPFGFQVKMMRQNTRDQTRFHGEKKGLLNKRHTLDQKGMAL
jgi:hypothetical protein